MQCRGPIHTHVYVTYQLFTEYESVFTAPEKRFQKEQTLFTMGPGPRPQGHPLDSSLISFTELVRSTHTAQEPDLLGRVGR